MRIVYLLESTALFGGTKVALLQAQMASDLGHQVIIVSREAQPSWIDIKAQFRCDPALDPGLLPPADVVVATFWTTLAIARAAPSGRAIHLCQGLEYTYTHNATEHQQIREAYRCDLPALCVAPHLVDELAQTFRRSGRVVRQPLEDFMRPAALSPPALHKVSRPNRVPRIAIVGPWEIDWKGVQTAVEAVRRLRGAGRACELVRLSQWPLSDAERQLLPPDEFHHHLEPPAVAELLGGCDLLLAGSWDQEGFGLPVLEAMACGVPVVCTDIAPYRWFASEAAFLVPVGDCVAMAAAAERLLDNPELWRQRRSHGIAAAEHFRSEQAATDLVGAFEWLAASGR